MLRGAEQERVAVGHSTGHVGGGDRGAGARPVLDDHRLPPLLRELFGHRTRHDVGAAASRVGVDDGHAAAGEGCLGQRRAGHGAQHGQRSGRLEDRSDHRRLSSWVLGLQRPDSIEAALGLGSTCVPRSMWFCHGHGSACPSGPPGQSPGLLRRRLGDNIPFENQAIPRCTHPNTFACVSRRPCTAS